MSGLANRGPSPPRLARALVRWACPSRKVAEVEGDLLEAFRRNVQRRGTRFARRRYWREVALLAYWAARRRLRRANGRSRAGSRSVKRRPGGWFTDLGQDVAYGVRTLLRTPGFTAIAVVILALGIGGNSTMLTLLNAIYLQPPPHVEAPEELVGVTRVGETVVAASLGFPEYVYYRDRNDVFSDVLAYVASPIAVAIASDDAVARGDAWLVSGNFFDVLGVRPEAGRWFLPHEDATPSAEPVLVLSHGFWTRHFGGDRAVVGGSIRLNGKRFTVVGITPEGFRGISPVESPPDIYVPTMMRDALIPGARWWHTLTDGRIDFWLRLVGRLEPGVDFETARANVTLLRDNWLHEYASWIEATDPEPFELGLSRRFQLDPSSAARLDRLLLLLIGVVTAVLLVASANVAMLLLARASGRGREMGIRIALGAGRGRVIRQLLTEGILLCAAGAAGGVAFAGWSAQAASTMFPLAFSVTFTPDVTVVVITAAIALLVALLSSLAPAWRLSGTDVNGALLRGAPATERSPLYTALVVGQIAVSIVLIVGAGLFVRSFREAQALPLGFDPDRKLRLSVELANHGYDDERGLAFVRHVLEAYAATPGVEAATVMRMVPFRGVWTSGIKAEGTAYADQTYDSGFNRVGPDYFAVMDIPVVVGREFRWTDRADTEPVVVINEKVAGDLWPGQPAVGRTLTRGAETYTVVGVARNARYYELGEAPAPQIYLPLLQTYASRMSFVTRTAIDPSGMSGPLQRVIQDYDPSVAVYGVTTLGEVVDDEIAHFRVTAVLVTIFGLLALLLASVGLYGVQSYLVTRRTREIGVRLALGADERQIAVGVLRRGMLLTTGGAIIGLGAAWGLARFIESMLFGVAARDVTTFITVPIALLIVAAMASLVPARRASHVDPMVALREE